MVTATATSSTAKTGKPKKRVRFFEHDDIFILDGDNSQFDLGLSMSSITGMRQRTLEEDDSSSENHDDSEDKEDATQAEEEEEDVDAEGHDSFSSMERIHHDSHVLRENYRQCVNAWSGHREEDRPHWQLLEGVFDDDMGEAKDVQKYILTFACVEIDGDSPRGLERQICRTHNHARKVLGDNATHTVLSEDFRLRHSSTEHKLSDEEIWKKLREVYSTYSKSAKSFARKMGKADEAAIQRGPVDQDVVLSQIEELKEGIRNGSLRRPSHSKQKLLAKQQRREERSRQQHQELQNSITNLGGGSGHKRSSKKSSKSSDHQADHQELHDNGEGSSELFTDIDKKGKTKKSSTWRSLKKSISKRVHRAEAPGASFRSM